MLCPRCKNPVPNNKIYCDHCGFYFGGNDNKEKIKTKKERSFFLLFGVSFVIFFIVSIFFVFFVTKKNINLSNEFTETMKSPQVSSLTTIKYDNRYIMEASLTDILQKIKEDSSANKQNCPNKQIVEIENRIETNYGIAAVNLCEINTNLVTPLEQVLEYIKKEYQEIKQPLTNITLANLQSNDKIASFEPVTPFITSSNGLPIGLKTQLVLNASYYLKTSILETTTQALIKQGWYPKNARNDASMIHEIGHYLLFVALLNHYQIEQITMVDSTNWSQLYQITNDYKNGTFAHLLIKEAHQNKDISEEEFRRSISMSAVANDENGTSYNETIAEAFHDTYLNGEKATEASKKIIAVLKAYMGVKA